MHYSLTVSKVNVTRIGIVDFIVLSATCADNTRDATIHVAPRLKNEVIMPVKLSSVSVCMYVRTSLEGELFPSH